MMKFLLSTAFILTALSLPAVAQTPETTNAVTPSVAPAAPATPQTAATAPLADGTQIAAVPPQQQAGTAAAPTPLENEINQQLSFQKPNVDVNKMPSLFFTVWEHDLILDARRGLTTRMPGTDDGVAEQGPRDVTLAGIVYHNSKEWTIWLNDLRVSPTAIPDEVIDLKVYKDYIELEWFDQSTNQIFPIRLRAHQRFNLDTRMFLPS